MNLDFTSKNEISLIKNSPDFIKQNIEIINRAEKFILFQTYIFIEDEYTLPLLDALIQQSLNEVEVFILFDAIGSPHLSKETIKRFQKAGVHFKFFQPALYFSHIGRRLHQKILIIDNKEVLIGGINYAKKFNNPNNQVPWLDYACLVRGEAANDVYKKIRHHYIKNFPQFKIDFKAMCYEKFTASGQTKIEVKINDWMRYKQEIYRSYLKAISTAEKEIFLLATYFIPGKKLLRFLKKASKRGVKIHLIFGEKSDHPVIDLVSDYYYQWYLKNNISIYEWGESIIHGKIALIDNQWVTVGSYNHNYISQYGNLEANLNIFNGQFNQVIRNEISLIIAKSTKITSSNLNQNLYTKLLTYTVYLLTNVIIFFSVIFIYKQKEK